MKFFEVVFEIEVFLPILCMFPDQLLFCFDMMNLVCVSLFLHNYFDLQSGMIYVIRGVLKGDAGVKLDSAEVRNQI
jgi:hypothetical protein